MTNGSWEGSWIKRNWSDKKDLKVDLSDCLLIRVFYQMEILTFHKRGGNLVSLRWQDSGYNSAGKVEIFNTLLCRSGWRVDERSCGWLVLARRNFVKVRMKNFKLPIHSANICWSSQAIITASDLQLVRLRSSFNRTRTACHTHNFTLTDRLSWNRVILRKAKGVLVQPDDHFPLAADICQSHGVKGWSWGKPPNFGRFLTQPCV